MAKRLFDIAVASIVLIICTPLFVAVAIGIRLTSPGPVFYRAERVGIQRKKFTMYKFRTMHIQTTPFSSVITAKNDSRVFKFGAWLRRTKVDELPQLLNVLRGEMSLVGPRPEDPMIVDTYYTLEHFETLCVLPGLASPGSIYNYTHGEHLIDDADPQASYIERLLPIKLAMDTIYVREVSFGYDIEIIVRTILTIAAIAIGKQRFPDPPEMKQASDLIYPVQCAVTAHPIPQPTLLSAQSR
jgi:lipopolysaccharide/colanic/teichoic acid biosynthesis glycosyltransferase